MVLRMDTDNDNRRIENLNKLLADLCEVEAWYRQGNRIMMTLSPHGLDPGRVAQLVRERLNLAGYTFSLTEAAERLTLTVDPRPRMRIPKLNIILFLLTLASVYLYPVYDRNLTAVEVDMVQKGVAVPQSIGEYLGLLGKAMPLAWTGMVDDLRHGAGVIFTLAIMSILLVHEMGHYLAGRRRGLAASWPYFIPAPNIIGTFGALIRSKSPFWNRRDLIEVGAAGPIAGWIVAVAWLIYGLAHSTIVSPEAANIKEMAFYLDGESVLVKVLTPLLVGSAPQGFVYIFPEAAFAGWVGILVTAMNLLPIGQFDGGHIVYGLLPDMQRRLAWVALAGLFALGLQSPMWWIFGCLGLLFRPGHPPTMNDSQPPGRQAMIMGTIAMIILIISFTPIPFR
jgi:membrane-associated protease RseP (regulator of RpoE activity)